MARLWREGTIVRAAALTSLAWAGCGSGVAPPDHIDGPDYRVSLIWMSDAKGVFILAVGVSQPVLFIDRAAARLLLSPGRTRIAMTGWDGSGGVTEVRDTAGTPLGTFDASLALVGWAGEDALVFENKNIASDVVRANLDGSAPESFDFGFTVDTHPELWRAATSPDGKYLAVSFLNYEVLAVDTASGAIVQTYTIDDSLYPAGVAWLYDDTLVIAGGLASGGGLATATLASSTLRKSAFAGSPCSVESWTPAFPMLLGAYVSSGDTSACTRRIAARANGTGLTPLDWLTDPAIPGATSAAAVYALSPDARRVVYQANGAINIASPDGTGATTLAPLQQAKALAW